MFENIGSKVKKLATFFMVIGIIESLVGGIEIMDNARSNGGKVFGVVVIILGSFVSWIGSWVMYAIGQTAEEVSQLKNQILGTNDREKEVKTETETETKIKNQVFTTLDYKNEVSLEIPSSFTSVGNNALSDLPNLESITINNGVKKIGNNAKVLLMRVCH